MTEITTETAVADGRRSRRVIEGEGMVEAARDFEHGGRVYEAGKSRIVADHPFVLRHPHLFRVAWADDTSAPVVRFREMTGSSSTTRGGGLYGVTRTLPRGKRPSWRID